MNLLPTMSTLDELFQIWLQVSILHLLAACTLKHVNVGFNEYSSFSEQLVMDDNLSFIE